MMNSLRGLLKKTVNHKTNGLKNTVRGSKPVEKKNRKNALTVTTYNYKFVHLKNATIFVFLTKY